MGAGCLSDLLSLDTSGDAEGKEGGGRYGDSP